MSILRRLHSAELHTRHSPGLGGRHAALHIVLRRKADVRTHLLIELPIKVALSKDRDKPGPRQPHYTHGLPPSLDDASTLPITVARRFHCVRSSFIWRLPALVIE